MLTAQTREDLTSPQMEVIAIGEPTRCEDKDCERQHAYERATPLPGADIWHVDGALHLCGIQPHDWVLVAPRSLVETDQSGLYCCGQDDILAVLTA